MITRVTREMAQSRLGDVPQEKVFWVRDGKVLKNLRDLEKALNEMSDETFRYHANDSKKDFSHWVDEVVGDSKLAHDLQKATNRQKAAKAVAARIEWLSGKMRTR